MARKTCIRRLSKRLPALDDDDDDLRQAIERVDELYPFGKNAPQKPAPIIEHAAPPARPGGMVEVAREMANGDAPTGQTLKQVVARLVVDFAQAQSAGGLADIEAREETKKILARGPDSDAAKAVVKARDAARERLLTLPTEDEGDARLEHKMMET
jgi:hypothetical protein